jgi:copper chaperone CopZ
MEQLLVTLPAMWADHHVLAVRAVLAESPGVESIEASAKDFTVNIGFEPSTTSADALRDALAAAGYPAGEAPGATDVPTNKPAWNGAGSRATSTNAADLAMSGDHRKY